MKDEMLKKALQYAKECGNEAEALLETLGKIPAPSHQEDKRAEFCKNWLLSKGATDVTIDKAKNVVCKINCTANNNLTVFMAHTDVVFPDETPLPMKKEGRILAAPGIGDDTANLTNLLMAAQFLFQEKLQPKEGLLLVANSCEEGLGNLDGCKEIFKTYGSRIKAFYSFDGYMPQCCSKAVGSYRYKINVKTKGGHSYVNFGNSNAIKVLSEMLEQLYKVDVPQGTTYNVGRIEGGTTVNSIAESAMMLFEYRSTSQKVLVDLNAQFEKIIQSFNKDDIKVKLEVLGIRPGQGEHAGTSLEDFNKACAAVIKKYCPDNIDYGAYSTDANVPLSLGISAVTLGTIKGAKAHTREEWVNLDSLVIGRSIALELLLQYME